MVEQICDTCGARYSMYAPACPKCGAPTTQPAKKPGCPQPPAPAPKPAKKAAPEQAKQAAPAEQPQQGIASSETAPASDAQPIAVASRSQCPCRAIVANPLALIGIFVAVFGLFKLLKK